VRREKYPNGWGLLKMILPRGLAQPTELVKQISALAPLPPGVVNFHYTVDEDWSGDSAIFFYVTLSDDAARREVLHENAKRIEDLIRQRLDAIDQWGLIPYFYFRSQSEQENLKEQVYEVDRWGTTTI
jgi:hypothetical protein